MNFIDLCAGIGGMRLGLEKAGHKCVGFCEMDKFALKSYKAMYDTEGEWEGHDITKITNREIEELAKSRQIDIICGGFPCQAFSVAGKRKGFADVRGNIFFDICRFIKIIKPKYFICENVKGLLSHNKGNTFATIINTLAELGYCVEWQVLNSKDFGVPQNRQRVFIVGHTGTDSRRKVFPIRPANGENPCKLKKLTYKTSQGQRLYSPNGLSVTLSSLGGGLGAKTGLYSFIDLNKQGNVKLTNDARTIQARYNKGVSNRSGENSGVAVFPILGANRIIKRQNGRRIKNADEPMYTLTAQDRHGVIFKSDSIRIRKLTPRECWRLQGFPDEYFNRAKEAGLSDSQLYKQAGNAVTVNVVKVIGEKIMTLSTLLM